MDTRQTMKLLYYIAEPMTVLNLFVDLTWML